MECSLELKCLLCPLILYLAAASRECYFDKSVSASALRIMLWRFFSAGDLKFVALGLAAAGLFIV